MMKYSSVNILSYVLLGQEINQALGKLRQRLFIINLSRINDSMK